MADVTGPPRRRGDARRRAGDERGVSTVLGYTLNVLVATLLVTGLLFAAGSLVHSQRDQAVRSELSVVGQRFAANIEVADRLSLAAGDGDVGVNARLPDRVAGAPYRIQLVVDGSNVTAVLTTDSPTVRVTVPIDNHTAVAPADLRGGPLEVTWTGAGPLEVHDA